ncbi:DUF3857 domain-containing protein [Mariniflexile gromovii]|uniref:DUF3857 domain-containing protein n=1 Tax=Mariniflexile gromovii TaxID=362523 RepID=A0ABS4BR86_9FLAO|nr:DUF3857 domain-containing protein [Mariniflexile gromovii]MBP0903094.1 DUF3857 domain-containing protein [Mariniflexile gromovii]
MKITAFLLSICFCTSMFAQNFDFGKVSKEELEEKFNPLDSSANATYLYKFRKTYFEYRQEKGFVLVTEIHERVKIYNQQGFEYTTNKVNLYKSGGDEEEVSSLKASTYILNEGKIEETKLKNDGIFKTELSKYFDETKFTMPNVKEGCVVEYKYKIYSPFFWNVDDFIFQEDIPIKKLDATFSAPEYYKFKANTKGFLSVTPKMSKKNDRITFNNKTRHVSGNTEFSTSNVDYYANVYEFSLSDIPALKDEPYVNNINNYRSAINYELSYTDFPQTPMKYYSTTWEDVVKSIYDNPNFGSELNKSGYYEKEIDEIIGTISDPVQRTSLIFDFVKNKVKWNGYYGYYTNEGVKKAYKDQVGNVAEINLMLTSMLRYAGLKAFPVLVSTRQNGVPLFPTREGYNYVVSYVKLPDGIILLDATNKYCTPNTLPFRALNWQGRVIAEHGGSELIDLYPKEPSKNTISMLAAISENGTLNGSYRGIKYNHDALSYREKYNDAKKEDFLEKLENKYGGMEISDFDIKNDFDISKPIVESYKFLKESQADVIGNKLYFSPLFFLKTSENPFKLEKREFPVDFGYPSSTKYLINIDLPEGYKVESAPTPVVLALPDNLGSFKYNLLASDTKIQLVIDVEINQSIISPIYYDALKAYFSSLVEKEAEQIVLTKV